MGTTIKVNNTVITVGNKNTAVASKESAIKIYDLEDLSAQAAEAYAIADVMYKTCESMHMFSSEGMRDVGNKISNGVKKVLHAIAEFFKKIAAYVTSFVAGNTIMVKAKLIAKRATALKASNTPFPGEKIIKAKYTTLKRCDEIIDMANTTAKAINSGNTVNESILESFSNKTNGEAGECSLRDWFKSWDDVISVCSNNQKGVVKALIAMKGAKIDIHSKKHAANATKLAESNGQSDNVETEVKKLKTIQKMTNLAVKGYTTGINCVLSVAAAACSAASKSAKEEKKKDKTSSKK